LSPRPVLVMVQQDWAIHKPLSPGLIAH